MTEPTIDPLRMIRPRRKIEGISAILLPFLVNGDIDWGGFREHVERTRAAGLTPAVNMDTGYVNLLDDATRQKVLEETRSVLGKGPFVAGAFLADTPGSSFDDGRYRREIERIEKAGGTPVVFPSFGLNDQDDQGIIDSYRVIARTCDRFIAFELGTMFAPFGRIYSLETYEELLKIPRCVGAKHSSLSRTQEWQRLQLRDAVRADFRVYTGNDLAIDMVMYGSDYLLGLSTFAPDLFAKRDAMWANGDPRFYELNDWLQYLGQFAFRAPVPAYKHSAAMFLALRGWISNDRTHSASPTRPPEDREVLKTMIQRLSDMDLPA